MLTDDQKSDILDNLNKSASLVSKAQFIIGKNISLSNDDEVRILNDTSLAFDIIIAVMRKINNLRQP